MPAPLHARHHRTVLLTMVAALAHRAPAETIHVPGDYPGIQAAIDAAVNGDEVVLAPILHAGGVDMLGKAITLRSMDPDDPAVVAATIVNGGDNIITITNGEGPDTVIAGLTLTGGGYSYTCCFPFGGCGTCHGGSGIWIEGSPTILNCVFDQAAPSFIVSLGSPTIMGCTFLWASTSSLPVVWLGDGAAILEGCRFIDVDFEYYKPWLSIDSASATVSNCVFSSQFNPDDALMIDGSSSIDVESCTFWGGEVHIDTGEIHNSIIWNGWLNPQAIATHCIVEGGHPGDGNLDLHPMFVDALNGDLRLLAVSPAIDAGDSTGVLPGATDLPGNPRIADDPATPDTGIPDGNGHVIDIGAYEFGSGDCNGNGTTDAADIFEGTSTDCDIDGLPDECEDATPDECSLDCNGNDIPDLVDIAAGTSEDCNGNLVPDECDIASGDSEDCNGNGVPDECDIGSGDGGDCNGNGVPDECDIAGGLSEDCDGNGVPDECQDPLPGYALDFEDVLDVVSMPSFAGFPADELTVSFWMRTPGGQQDGLLSYAVGAADNEFLVFAQEALEIWINDVAVPTGVAVNDGVWHHVAATWRSADGDLVLYKDGVAAFQTQHEIGASLDDGGALVLAQEQDCVGGCFNSNQAYHGTLDEVRLWNVVRTAEEIQADMFQTLDGDEPGLVGYWRLDEGSGDVAGDSAGPNDGEITGASWVPTIASSCCPADIDGSGVVDVADLVEVVLAWGTAGPSGDVNGDDVVDVLDLVEIIMAWGPCPR